MIMRVHIKGVIYWYNGHMLRICQIPCIPILSTIHDVTTRPLFYLTRVINSRPLLTHCVVNESLTVNNGFNYRVFTLISVNVKETVTCWNRWNGWLTNICTCTTVKGINNNNTMVECPQSYGRHLVRSTCITDVFMLWWLRWSKLCCVCCCVCV